MTAKQPSPGSPPEAPVGQQEVERLAQEVDAARASLGQLVGHLDRKRHALTRKLPLVLISAALVGVVLGGIALAVARRRRRQALPSKLERLRAALGRIAAHPERLGSTTTGYRKIATGAATAGGSVLAKHLAKKLLHPGFGDQDG
jgi:hypothetical protein